MRCCFILANLTADDEPSRLAVADAAAPQLLGLLHSRTAALLAALAEDGDDAAGDAAPAECARGAQGAQGAAAKGGGSGAGRAGRVERADELVKVVRLLAHLAISPRVGAALAASPQIASLLELLELHARREARQGRQGRRDDRALEISLEELLLNTTSALTNLSYYTEGGERGDNQLLASPERLVRGLVPVLLHPNPEASAEAARAFGNLSRLAGARALMCGAQVHGAPPTLALVLTLAQP